MLASLKPSQIQKAILNEDLQKIKGIKGIGLKTAQRVIIELKDKIKSLSGDDEIPSLESNTIKDEALSALEVLGYSRRSSENVIDNLIQSNSDSSLEELIKGALNKL